MVGHPARTICSIVSHAIIPLYSVKAESSSGPLPRVAMQSHGPHQLGIYEESEVGFAEITSYSCPQDNFKVLLQFLIPLITSKMYTAPRKDPRRSSIMGADRRPNPLRYVNLKEWDDGAYGDISFQESQPDSLEEPWPYRFQVACILNWTPLFL